MNCIRTPYYGWMLLLASVGQTLVYIVYYYDLRRFPVWFVKVFLLFMPVVASLICFFAFGEKLTVVQLGGMAVILIGALGILLEQRKNETGSMEPVERKRVNFKMEKAFHYYMPVKILFDYGVSQKMASYIAGENVLIISDPFLYQNGVTQRIGESLIGKTVGYFSDIEPNPSCESVDAAAAAARALKADCVIGLGGGSSMDVAKIVACLTRDEGSIYDYYSGGTKTFSERKTMLICVPTTAGTGSEVTNVGVFTNKKAGIKMPLVTDRFWADYAVIDPELTYSLPPAVTASTGMDAFCHAIETYWNKESQPMCDMLAMGAMQSSSALSSGRMTTRTISRRAAP